MGCQHPDRADAFASRYAEWEEEGASGVQPFHYGSHYSTSAHVLHYLVRIEPYMSYHLALQEGRFDIADRLFHSVADSWADTAGNSNLADVKELIPEFFYLPHFLVNGSGAYLGQRQDGSWVDDVQLPAWARNDPREFIRVHRLALESPYVSAHLHEWVDLVFGFKQKGKAAVQAINVFYHITYEGAVDLEEIENDTQREAIKSQIAHFGQTPRQLFFRPHPQRAPPPLLGLVLSNPELLVSSRTVKADIGDALLVHDRVVTCAQGGLLVPPSGEACVMVHRGHPGSVAVLSTEQRRSTELVALAHDHCVTAMAVAANGEVLATGGAEGTVRLWDMSQVPAYCMLLRSDRV